MVEPQRIDHVRKIVPLTDVLPNIKSQGSNTCPFCGKRSKFYVKGNTGKCFSPSCRSEGKVVDVIRAYQLIHHSYSYEEALYSLEEEKGISPSQVSPIYEEAMALYHKAWLTSDKPRRDMEASKKIPVDYLTSEGVGWSSGRTYLTDNGMSFKTLVKAGLWNSKRACESFEGGRVIFPVRGKYLKGMVGRDLYPNGIRPRYKNSKANYELMILEDKLLESYDLDKPIFLCEGPTDTHTLRSRGFQAVGTLGLHGLPRHQYVLRKAKNLKLVYDADRFSSTHERYPNQYKSWTMVMPQLYDLQLFLPQTNIYMVTLPDGKDVNDFITTINNDQWIDYVKTKQTNFLKYFLRKNSKDMSSHMDMLRLVSATGKGKNFMRKLIGERDPLEYCLEIFKL